MKWHDPDEVLYCAWRIAMRRLSVIVRDIAGGVIA